MKIDSVKLPHGVSVVERPGWRDIAPLKPFETHTHRFNLTSTGPAKGPVEITFSGPGAPQEPVLGAIDVTADPKLPRAAYVPRPQPVESDYEIGMFYHPGWGTSWTWDVIRRTTPQRKPLLGWYDEANPEAIDWQIKWAVEHGIKFLMVNWYWKNGAQHHDHWVQSYPKARYRDYIKWCLHWCNHTAPMTHSVQDQRTVTRYWIDNYFKQKSYYRIDDKPVVVIWDLRVMARDMGWDGVKTLLDVSQDVARKAGFKGVYFVMVSSFGGSARWRDMGFANTSHYQFLGATPSRQHINYPESMQRSNFKRVAEASYSHWRKVWSRDKGVMPYMPPLSAGWDPRPWHGDQHWIVYGRTVGLFRQICRDARRFGTETGIRRFTLCPLNEWGEGMYLEPNAEYGFGMYDVARDAFCKEPAGGWPPNVVPEDVGLGPYDYAPGQTRTYWDFAHGNQYWKVLMGVKNMRAEGGRLEFTTTSGDPAIRNSVYREGRRGGLDAAKYPSIIIRMKIDGVGPNDSGQLFFATDKDGVSAKQMVGFKLIADGEYHDYAVEMSKHPRWRGKIEGLRFDPCGTAGARVSIEEIRFSTKPPRAAAAD